MGSVYCMCVDSGSMKDHLPLLKETLKFMVQQLRADDRLSLISFDDEVSVEVKEIIVAQLLNYTQKWIYCVCLTG